MSEDTNSLGSADTNISASLEQQSAELPAILALTPLLALSDSLAVSLAGWALLVLASLVGASLLALTRRLSPSLPLHIDLPVGFLLYSLATSLLLAVASGSHFILLREAGIYFSLLGCSAFLLMESPWLPLRLVSAEDAKPPALLAQLKMGVMTLIRYGSLLLVFALLRELLFTGTLMRDWQLLIPYNLAAPDTAIYTSSAQWIPLAGTVPGGFIMLALLVTARQLLLEKWLLKKRPQKKVPEEGDNTGAPVQTATRARVTEQL